MYIVYCRHGVPIDNIKAHKHPTNNIMLCLINSNIIAYDFMGLQREYVVQ